MHLLRVFGVRSPRFQNFDEISPAFFGQPREAIVLKNGPSERLVIRSDKLAEYHEQFGRWNLYEVALDTPRNRQRFVPQPAVSFNASVRQTATRPSPDNRRTAGGGSGTVAGLITRARKVPRKSGSIFAVKLRVPSVVGMESRTG